MAPSNVLPAKSWWRRHTDPMFEMAFYNHGLFCATNPFLVIVGMSCLILIVSWPSFPLLFGNGARLRSLHYDAFNSPESAWGGNKPTESAPRWMQRAPVARILQLQFILTNDKMQDARRGATDGSLGNLSMNILGIPPNVSASFTPESFSSMLSRAFIRRVGFTIPREMHEFRTKIEGKEYSLRDFCTLEMEESISIPDDGSKTQVPITSSDGQDTRCLMYHVGSLWDHNETDFLHDSTLARVRQRADVSHPGRTSAPVQGAARGTATPLPTAARTHGMLNRIPITAPAPTSAFVPASDNDEQHVPRAMLVRNLRNLHSCAKSGHLVADSAMLLLSLNAAGSFHDAAVEGEFFKRLWESVLPEMGKTSSYGYNSQSVQFTYLRYRKTVSSAAEKAYLGVAFMLIFFYIYFTVARFEFVKSKTGLAFAAVVIILASTMLAIGLCTALNLITTVTAVEILPFLIVAIGLDNMTVITKSVVSKFGLPIRYQVAEGLAEAGPQLMQSLLAMELVMLLGVYSRIHVLQEFCAIAAVSLLCEFVFEIMFYVSCLSLDIRYVELSDFTQPWFQAPNERGVRARELRRKSGDHERHVRSPTTISTRSLTVTPGHGDKHATATLTATVWNSLPLQISLLSTIIFSLLGGLSPAGSDHMYTRTSVPSVSVDWRLMAQPFNPSRRDDCHGSRCHGNASHTGTRGGIGLHPGAQRDVVEFLPPLTVGLADSANNTGFFPEVSSTTQTFTDKDYYSDDSFREFVAEMVARHSEGMGTSGSLWSWHHGAAGLLWKSLGLSIDMLDAVRGHVRRSTVVMVVTSLLVLLGVAAVILRRKLIKFVFGRRRGTGEGVEAFGMTKYFEVSTFVGHQQDIECLAAIESGANIVHNIPTATSVTPDTRSGATPSLFVSACLGGEVRIWDHESMRCVEVLRCNTYDAPQRRTAQQAFPATLPTHTTGLSPIVSPGDSVMDSLSDTDSDMTPAPWCLTSHHHFVAVGHASGTVEIWDLSTGTMVQLPPCAPLPGEGERNLNDGGGITCLCFVDDALLTASSTGVIQQWQWTYGNLSALPSPQQRRHHHSPEHMAKVQALAERMCAQQNTTAGTPHGATERATEAPEVEIASLPRRGSGRGLHRIGSYNSLASAGDHPGCPTCGSAEHLGQLLQMGTPFARGHAHASTAGGGTGGGAGRPRVPQMFSLEDTAVESSDAESTASTPRRQTPESADGENPTSRTNDAPQQPGSSGHPTSAAGANGHTLAFRRVRSKLYHKSSISVLVATNKHVISASTDKLIKVFDKQLQCLRTLYGHDGGVTCLALDCGTHVASGSHDATVRLWCVDTGVCECVLEGHTDSVLNVGVDATHVVSSSEDDTIRVWSRRRAEVLHVLREPSMSFVLHLSSVLVTACDGVLTAWDLLGNAELLRSIPLVDDTVPDPSSGKSARLRGRSTQPDCTVTNHLVAHGNRVICDLGCLIKSVDLPFPPVRQRKTKAP
eukprot:m.1336988 g.1336988  ORF g.1336988 m.1336988 type:complete len:1474 (-) comp24881_c0_seq3:488-4909(-)